MRRVSIASASQIAADAGSAVADAGGNAVDAAVGAVICSMVTDPGIIAPGLLYRSVLWSCRTFITFHRQALPAAAADSGPASHATL